MSRATFEAPTISPFAFLIGETVKEILTEAKTAEDSGESENAVELYGQALQQDKLNEHAYNRLMIIHRKAKDKKKELQIINSAIKAYKEFYASKKRTTKNITAISNKLNKLIGLIDKKGNHTYDPEPLGKWKKRKGIVAKKVK